MRILTTFLVVIGLAVGVMAEEKKEAPRVEFRPGQYEPAEGLTEMAIEDSAQKICLQQEVQLSEADLAAVSVRMQDKHAVIEIQGCREDRGNASSRRSARRLGRWVCANSNLAREETSSTVLLKRGLRV